MKIASLMAIFFPLNPSDKTRSKTARRSRSQEVTVLCFSLVSQDRIQIEQGTLNITVVGLADAGMYQCVAENRHGIIFSSAELSVIGEYAGKKYVSQ